MTRYQQLDRADRHPSESPGSTDDRVREVPDLPEDVADPAPESPALIRSRRDSGGGCTLGQQHTLLRVRRTPFGFPSSFGSLSRQLPETFPDQEVGTPDASFGSGGLLRIGWFPLARGAEKAAKRGRTENSRSQLAAPRDRRQTSRHGSSPSRRDPQALGRRASRTRRGRLGLDRC